MSVLDRFMRLEEIKTPEEWIKKNCQGAVYNELTLELTTPCHIIVPFTRYTFYELYDFFEDKGFDFKIYPIEEKTHWVVEVK